MFKKLASEALGLSDIGKIIPPSEFDKVDSDDFVLHEDGEKIFFLIKSKRDEYCFTDRALIHVDGESAINSKRMLKRYEYYKYPISDVLLETAGTIDLDVEIKFHIGEVSYSIDVDKKQIDPLKDLYKALYAISQITSSNKSHLDDRLSSLNMALQAIGAGKNETVNKSEELPKIAEYVHGFISGSKETYIRKDFSDVFLKYINN